MTHLTPETLQAVLAGTEGDAALLAHLEAGCDACDAVMEHSAPLDAAVDVALLRLAPPRIGAAPPTPDPAPPVPRPPRPPGVALLGAPAAALTVGGLWWQRPADTDGLKGAPLPPAIELSAAVRARDGSFRPLGAGDFVSARDTLVFRAQTSLAAEGLLLLQRGSARPEVLGPVHLTGGPQLLQGADGLLGVSLEGEQGEVTLWLVAGPQAPSPAEAVAAIAFPAPALTRVPVRVRVQP